MRRMMRIALVCAIFVAGYVAGSATQRPAQAQLGELGGKVMEKAGSGSLGSVGKLGSAIVDMQKDVDSLQKNLETLKQVKTALGG